MGEDIKIFLFLSFNSIIVFVHLFVATTGIKTLSEAPWLQNVLEGY